VTVTAPAQSTYQDTSKKQTTKDESTTVEKSKSQTTHSETKATEGKKTSGVSKEKVRQTQTALKRAGFDPGPIDGIMGPMTKTALRIYQSHHGLQVTGTINAETENALMERASASTRSTRESLGVSQEGTVSNMEEVRQLQQALKDMEYNPGEVNGMMTSQTQQAIREFQWLNNLPVTGTLDEQTRTAIVTGTGGVETAQLSRSHSIEREKPSADITAEEQAQTRTDTQAQKDRDADTSKVDHDAAKRVSKAADVLQELTTGTDKKIPNELLERAEAIAVIPGMVKGAFGIGGRYGKGVVSQRLENGRWSPPAFLQIGGGSFGAQLGVSSTDVVLVFTDRNALDLLEEGKDLKLGVDAAAVAGPIGRSAEAGVNLKLETAIYSYSRAKGLFVGVALDGAVLDIDNSEVKKVYGSSVTAKDVLNGRVPVNATVRPFVDTLERVVPKKKLSQK
jgi:lipid-binding SYLF domain-containing protein